MSPSFAPVTALVLLEQLQQGAVTAAEAYTIPLRPGRKHLLPEARWGAIRTDNATLNWTHADAQRLRTVTDLQRYGFKPTQLIDLTPPWRQLSRLTRTKTLEVIHLWQRLAVWRASPPWLDLATHIVSKAARSA